MDRGQMLKSCFVAVSTLALGSVFFGAVVHFLIPWFDGTLDDTAKIVDSKNHKRTVARRKSRKSIVHPVPDALSPSSTCMNGGTFPGLYNLGTTCFANALLQGLASCPSVIQWLHKLDDNEHFQRSYFLSELQIILSVLNSPGSDDDSAEGVLNALHGHGWIVTSYTEQDLFELLNVFVSTWDEELQAFSKRETKSLMQAKDTEESIESLGMLGVLSDMLSYESAIRSPFFGLSGTQFQCRRCLKKHVRHDKFTALSLVIPKYSNQSNVTLENCLKKYFAIEVVNGVSCENCVKMNNSGMSNLNKKQGISKFPLCLIFRIERKYVSSTGVTFKRCDHVQFPEILDVRDLEFYRNNFEEYEKTSRELAAGDAQDVKGGKLELLPSQETASLPSPIGTGFQLGLQQNALISGGSHVNSSNTLRSLKYKYKLYAVSVHLGTAESGHFVTYRRGSSINYVTPVLKLVGM